MKRYLSFALLLSLLFALSGCGQNVQEPPLPAETASASATPVMVYGDTELDRAVSLGIGVYEEPDQAATYAQFFGMLDRVAGLVGSSQLASWQKQLTEARASNAEMTRMEGMMAVLKCALSLGDSYTEFNTNWQPVNDEIGEKVWTEIEKVPNPYQWISDEFPYSSGGFTKDTYVYDWDFFGVAYRYAFGRVSQESGETIFDYDSERNSMRPEDIMTYSEAMLAALRLYESTMKPVTERIPTAADAEILQAAEERKTAILTSETTVEVTGKKYYISNDGNDANDGRTPETAWATLSNPKLSPWSNVLKPGDGVFFERGGLWRGELRCSAGVTYSAYGEGPKPRIISSPESGVGADKWQIWYDKDGVKIWKFYHDISEVACIVFNGGESYASRVFSYWNGENTVSVDDYQTPFDIQKDLKFDMQFYSYGDYSAYTTYSKSNDSSIGSQRLADPYEIDTRNTVYLRCDRGNPGELFGEIEFSSSVQYIKPGYFGIIAGSGDGFTVDNLCVMYSFTMGLNNCGCNNVTFQNCEVAWVGGASHSIGYINGDTPFLPVAGEGIRMEGTNNKSINNYVHDCFDGGITVEFSAQFMPKADGMEIRNNVIERCISGVLAGEHNEDSSYADKVKFSGIRIADNYIMYSGYGWSSDPHYNFTWNNVEYNGNAITWWYGPLWSNAGEVSNNVLYIAKHALIMNGAEGENKPALSGNTYVQNNNGIIAFVKNDKNMFTNCSATNDEHIKDIVHNTLGDKTAQILPLS